MKTFIHLSYVNVFCKTILGAVSALSSLTLYNIQKSTVAILLLLSVKATQAQNLGVNTLNPDASAILDITHTSRGLLIPRLPLTSTTDVTTITSPALSLLVFNTNTAGVPPNDVKPGFYYFNGTKWVGIGTGNAWELLGNTGTIAGTNFIGTTDAQDVVFKTNSVENMRILNTNGNVGIGTTTPLSQLHIDGGAANSLLNVGTAGQRQLIMGNRNSTAALLNGGLGAYSSIMAANGEMRFGLTEQVNPLAIQYATFMTIQNAGNVGIGTVVPNSKLEVFESSGTTSELRISSTTPVKYGELIFSSNNTGFLDRGASIEGNGENTGIDVGAMVFKTQYGATPRTERMRINSGGNVGIGTTTPTLKLHLHDAAQNFHALRFTSGVSQANYWDLVKRGDAYLAGQNHNFVFSYNGAEHISIAPTTGNMGLGVATPTQKLDVAGSIKITDGSEGVGKVLTSDATGKGTWVANIPQNYIGTIVPDAVYGPSYPSSTALGDQVVISTPGTYMIVYQRYFTKLSGGTNDFHLQLSDNNFATVLSDVTLQVTPQNVWFQGSIIQIQTYTVPTTLKGGYALFAGSYNSIGNGSCMFAIRLQ
jgi:hypothetical protein